MHGFALVNGLGMRVYRLDVKLDSAYHIDDQVYEN